MEPLIVVTSCDDGRVVAHKIPESFNLQRGYLAESIELYRHTESVTNMSNLNS
jgi:hypothetical protein